jgi:alpha/beta superfamily hydrolase
VVGKNQYLERAVLVPVREGLVLEGLWHRGARSPALLILAPPPHEGGSMDHVIAAELAWAAAHAGHPVLRFNYRGVGASQGERSVGQALVEDAEAALRLAQDNVDGPVAVVALFGAALLARALLELHPDLPGIAFVEPPQTELEEWPRLRAPFLVLLSEHSTLARAAAAQAVGEGGRLEVIPGADARFQKNLAQLGHAVARWLPGLAYRTLGG